MISTSGTIMTQSIPRVRLACKSLSIHLLTVTNSSSGFGRAMVKEVLGNGEMIAIATLQNPSILDDLAAKYPRTRLLVLPLDVMNEA